MFSFASLGSCNWPDPANDSNPEVVDDFNKLNADRDRAHEVLREKQQAYDRFPSDITREAVEAAQAAVDAAEENFAKWELEYYRNKNGPIISFFSSMLGSMHPAGQVAATGVTAVALRLGIGMFAPRSRRLTIQAVKKVLSPKTKFEPIGAIVDVVKATGWLDSSESSRKAAEADIELETANKESASAVG